MVIQGLSAFDKSMRFCGRPSGRQSPRRPNRASGWIEESDRLSQRGLVGGRSRSAVKYSVGRGDIENVFER